MKSLFAACPKDWKQAWQSIMYNSALGGELGLSQVLSAGMLAQLAPDGSSVSSQFQETLHGDFVQAIDFNIPGFILDVSPHIKLRFLLIVVA